MPEELVDQIPLIKEALEAFCIPIFELEGYEGDDILGTLATQAAREKLEVFLVTNDKDALQLLGPRVQVYRPTRDGHEVIDEKSLYKRWKLKSSQVVDVMALMGDSVDAIPGVPGIGEKTAVALIQEFGSVDRLLDAVGEEQAHEGKRSSKQSRSIRPRVAKSIRDHQQAVHLSRELATLDLKVPIKVRVSDLKVQDPDEKRLRLFYQKLEFRHLLKELAPAPDTDTGSVKVQRLDSVKDLKRFLPQILESRSLALVIREIPASREEPSSSTQRSLGMGLAWESGAAVAVPLGPTLEGTRFLWEARKGVKICPDLKQTLVFLEKAGIEAEGPWKDPTLASYLLDPSRPSHRVADLAQEFLEEPLASLDSIEGFGREAEAALRLMPRFEKEIRAKSLETLLTEVEVPLSGILARMQVHGMSVDVKRLEVLSKEIHRTLDRLTGQIHQLAGEEFNINSPKQLSRILFEGLKLPVIKRTKTGISTDEEVLRSLSPHHELPRKILEYRELNKLNSTYVEALPRLVDPQTGRVHALFHQTVTATGRLSASNPNLQNIPVRTELGRQIRAAFVPSESKWLFLAADYSQIELRILAHLSEDSTLIEAFRKGADIHRVTAAEIFHVDPEQVQDDQRSAAKTINFGIVYGMTPFGLAKELKLPPDQAGDFIDRYFERYPGVRRYLTDSLKQTRERGYCTTLFHRRRYIPELSAKQVSIRQFAERMAINAPIQGSAADLIKVAMVAIERAFKERSIRSRMVCQVHDELIFEVPDEEMELLKALVREIMEAPHLVGKPIRLRVPIKVNLKVGSSWLETSHA